MRYSEDQLESVLNLPVADVAGGVGHAKCSVAQGTFIGALNSADLTSIRVVLDYSSVHVEVYVRIAEHGMIKQVEELQAELKFSFLAEHFDAVERQIPVLVDGEIHGGDSRSRACARSGVRISAQMEAFVSVGRRI